MHLIQVFIFQFYQSNFKNNIFAFAVRIKENNCTGG